MKTVGSLSKIFFIIVMLACVSFLLMIKTNQAMEGQKKDVLSEAELLLELRTVEHEVPEQLKITAVLYDTLYVKNISTTQTVLKAKQKDLFEFPESVSKEAQEYLKEVYSQAYEACKDTIYPDPFMAMSLAVVEKPVADSEVFRLPLVDQDTLDKALKNGSYSSAINDSKITRSFNSASCAGPLQIAVKYVAAEKRNPTIWLDSCQMFYEDAELAVYGMTVFAEKCELEVTDVFLKTLSAMRHNVGNLSDWEYSKPDSATGLSYIPFKSKRAVYEWNKAVSTDRAQEYIRKAAYESYLDYLETGIYENQGVGWREIANLTGYDQSKVLSDHEWWRPLYSIRFWYNYYLLQYLYGYLD